MRPAPPDPIARRTGDHRADIDGLRGVAIAGVLLFHAAPRALRGGFVGVDVFFVISGFLIGRLLLEDIAGGRFSLIDFYARRTRRLFPALIVVLTSCLAIGAWVLLPADYAHLGLQSFGGVAFVANFFEASTGGYFDTDALAKPLLHLWSLGVEEQFYLLWPLLLMLAARARLHTGRWIALACAASFGLSLWMVRDDPQGAFFLPAPRFWQLGIGSLLAWASWHRATGLQGIMARKGARQTMAIAGALLIVAAMFALHRNKAYPGAWALAPTLGAALLIAAGPHATINRHVLASAPLRALGAISFPLYLWHWPLLAFLHLASIDEVSTAQTLAAVALSVVLAAATWRFVETPIRFGRARRHAVPWLAAAMLAIGAAGLAIDRSGGLPARRVHIDAPQRAFVQRYRELHLSGLQQAYREACDFHPWTGHGTRERIAADCVAPVNGPSVMLWGDSHAQALSLGLRESLPAGMGFTQVATSGCKPSLQAAPAGPLRLACDRGNAFAIEALARTRPATLLLAQSEKHDATDWQALAELAHRHGVEQVVLLGPLPQWRPSLPVVVARRFDERDALRVARGLDPAVLESDRALKASLAGSSTLQYVSLIDGLCNAQGCIANVPAADAATLIAVDYGHLSPAGSRFVGRRLLAPLLRPAPAMTAQSAHRISFEATLTKRPAPSE